MTQTQIAAPKISKKDLVRAAMAMAGGGGNAYTAASQFNRDIGMWRPPLRSADAEIFRDHSTVRARARDLARNHPYARQTVRVSRLGVIGDKLKYSCRPDHKFLGLEFDESVRWAQEFERLWESYAHGPDFLIDASRRLNFTQLMGLVHDSDLVDGEALVSLEWDPGREWKTCFQVIDIDRLSNPNGLPDDNYLRAGISIDSYGSPHTYHIRNAHPGDVGLSVNDNLTWSGIPRYSEWGRQNLNHTFEHSRAAQSRGISVFAPVIRAMKMGAEYTETALAAAVLQASFAAVITSPSNIEQVAEVLDALDEDDTSGNAITDYALDHLRKIAPYYGKDGINFSIAGLKVPHLAPGDALDLKQPGQQASSFGDFQAHQVKSYAAGTGTDPIAVSQDFSNVNYSSARMSAAMSARGYRERRARLVSGVAMNMVGGFLDEVVFSGALDMPKGVSPGEYFRARSALMRGTFLTHGAPNLDPVKEAQALKLERELGTTTLQDACAAKGLDHLEQLDQIQREMKEYELRGIPYPGAGVLPNSIPGEGPSAGDNEEMQDAA